jgi:polysaccharide deacetylase 2 family uncharacterized protein YibQ
MMRVWCWLFATCVAAMQLPTAPRLVLREPYSAPPEAPRTSADVRVALAPPPGPAAASLDELVLGGTAGPPPTGADGFAAEGLVALASPPPATPIAVVRPAAARPATVAPPAGGRPTISIVIDGLGAASPQSGSLSARAIALPAPLALAWLPRAPHLADQVAQGAAHGHEALLHLPTESLGRAHAGPGVLRTWLPPAANLAALRADLALLPDAVGLTEDEASVAALSVPLMDLVMGELRARHLGFLDDGALPGDAALRRAEAAGLPAASHDLFIDGDPDPAAIRARLAEAEGIARRRGHAILIAHPRPSTLDVLEQYLPSLNERGFVLWPVSAALAAETAEAGLKTPPAPRREASTIAPLISSGTE